MQQVSLKQDPFVDHLYLGRYIINNTNYYDNHTLHYGRLGVVGILDHCNLI